MRRLGLFIKIFLETLFFFLTKKKKIPLNGLTLDETDAKLVKRVLGKNIDNHEFSAGSVKDYEKKFARAISTDYVYAFISGRVALSACIYALGLRSGDQVIVPAFTCIAVTNAFLFAGVKPVLCDIELDTYGLDLASVKKLLREDVEVSAILIQHTFGLVSRDYLSIIEFAKQNNWLVIEDCTHAFGASYNGLSVGKLGHAAFFSSENSKVFSTFRGGVAVTDHQEVASKMAEFQANAHSLGEREIKQHLQNVLIRYYQKKYFHLRLLMLLHIRKYRNNRIDSTSKEELNSLQPHEYNLKMPPELAVIGINQLEKIDRLNEKRRMMAMVWKDWSERHGFQIPQVIEGSVPVFLRYPVLVTPEMKENHSWARELNVEVGVWFLGHRHPLKEITDIFPKAAKAIRCCVNFPTLLDQ